VQGTPGRYKRVEDEIVLDVQQAQSVKSCREGVCGFYAKVRPEGEQVVVAAKRLVRFHCLEDAFQSHATLAKSSLSDDYSEVG
jgi:hypothetical protein